MRRIALVTGTRAEYGYLKPLMKEIKKDKALELLPVVTGMHLLKEFGYSYKNVEKDFKNIYKIPMRLRGDNLEDMAYYLSDGIKNITNFLKNKKPGIVVVLGDRSESFASAIAAMYLNIPIAHINGGDVTGGVIDESIRHAITKIAHIHLAHTKENAERIIKMGERRDNVHVVGALTLDVILNKQLKSKKEIFDKYNLDYRKTTFLAIQHPVTTLDDKGLDQMKELLLALKQIKNQTIMLYPNCDAGGKQLIDLIKQYEKEDFLHVFKNMSHEDYLSLMKNVNLLIGNSSSGIIEAPTFKIPVINIGNRQKGRTRSENIIDVKPDKKKILKSIDYALNKKEFQLKINKCKNRYGDGKSAQKIVDILKKVKINESLIQKQITY